MQQTKTKTLVYKSCSFHKGSNNLETLLKSAARKLKTVGQRRQALGPSDESPIWLVIAQQKIDASFFFGLLVQYTPGMAPSFLVDDVDAANLSLEHMKAPKTADGKERQLLESMLFFGAMDNHLVMMQSQALKSLQLERHLMWLLHHAECLQADDTIQLADQVPKATREKLRLSPVKSISIGGDLSAAKIEPADEEEHETLGRRRLVPKSLAIRSTAGSEQVLDLLKGLVSESSAAKLNLDGIEGGNIEYSLEIRYKRSTTVNGQKFLKKLGSSLRHAEGVDTKIELQGGGSIQGDALKLTSPIKINTIDGVPNPDDVFEAMRQWLLTRVRTGEIEV